MYRQANYDEPLILDYKSRVKEIDVSDAASKYLPSTLVRKDNIGIPNLPEVEVVRHYLRLSQKNYGVDTGFYPLGSCTMKYNPKINERLARDPRVTELHPMQPVETVQGALETIYLLEKYLAEISGMDAITLQPAAGAHGEFVGVSLIKAYHAFNGEDEQRTEIIVPDSAHGTNPASAAMGGYKVVVVPSNEKGQVDIDALRSAVSEKTAGMMITNPNTLGIFESEIKEISKIIRSVGGLLYYDGANLNAIMGHARPGDMGFDIVHINLHKTFSTPHGGGGPGAGAVGVKKDLEKFLPVPRVKFDEKAGKYYWDYDHPHSIGRVHTYYGNFALFVRALAYILRLGKEGIKSASSIAVLNSNYLMRLLEKIDGLDLIYDPSLPRKHEFVISAAPLLAKHGISANHLSKGLIDAGVHAPTVYFPLIVHEALMWEPTESETKANLDKAYETMKNIIKDLIEHPEKRDLIPMNTSVGPIDNVKASRNPIISWKMLKKQKQ